MYNIYNIYYDQMDDDIVFDDNEIYDDNVDDINEVYDEDVDDSDIVDDIPSRTSIKEEDGDEDDNDNEELDDEDEEDEDDESRLNIVRNNIFQVTEGYEEDTNTIFIVKPEERITSEYMTIYEYAMVIGVRATHIAKGSFIFTDITNLDDPRQIAIKEINEGKCPLNITRRLRHSNKIELWTVNEMIKPIS